MANPPFNVDEVDAEKVKGDKRLPFGLPGVNKGKKVSNANYLWLSYFYSYLNENGRAGVVMSSQASSAGRDEAVVRQKIVETGAVDVMIDIRGNFFYTRTVPCQLWFFDRAKERDEERRDQVLMLDARNIYRKVSRAIYDFSPEQQKNIAAIVWLYRGTGRALPEAGGVLHRRRLLSDGCGGRRTARHLRAGARQADRPSPSPLPRQKRDARPAGRDVEGACRPARHAGGRHRGVQGRGRGARQGLGPGGARQRRPERPRARRCTRRRSSAAT